MGTRFEAVLWGDDEDHLEAAAAEALGEIARIGARLSAFDPGSDVCEVNSLAATRPVRTDPRLVALLGRCCELWEATAGAFDVTVGSLMRRWGFRGPASDGDDRPPVWGMQHLILDRDACTVAFARSGLSIDLGAVAKGYALDQAGEILRACGVGGALLHGGTSSVLAVGLSPTGEPWRVEVRNPDRCTGSPTVIELADRALGVSAAHGRTLESGDASYGHVMDPRSGEPVASSSAAAVAGPSATDADALATALLVLGAPFEEDLRADGYWCRLLG